MRIKKNIYEAHLESPVRKGEIDGVIKGWYLLCVESLVRGGKRERQWKRLQKTKEGSGGR